MSRLPEPLPGGIAGSPSHECRGRRQVCWSWENQDRTPALTLIVVVGCLAAVAMAVFGLPPVDVHGTWHYLGFMDPLCGMTRATRLLALGQMSRAVEYNPASPLLGVLGAVVLVRAGIGWATGRWLRVEIHPSRATLTVLALLVGLLWAHQQMHAALLMHT